MKTKYYLSILLLGMIFCVNSVFSQSIDNQILGTYTLSSPTKSSVIKYKIMKNQVTVYNNGKLAEKYFLYQKDGANDYTLQRVKLDVNSIDINKKEDRKLYKVNIVRLAGNKLKLRIILPNKKQQEITITKL